MYDEGVYPKAAAFDPERFMGERPAPHPMSRGAFGYGRRSVAFEGFLPNSDLNSTASAQVAFLR